MEMETRGESSGTEKGKKRAVGVGFRAVCQVTTRLQAWACSAELASFQIYF